MILQYTAQRHCLTLKVLTEITAQWTLCVLCGAYLRLMALLRVNYVYTIKKSELHVPTCCQSVFDKI